MVGALGGVKARLGAARIPVPRWPFAERLADLPVMSEGVLDSSQQPTVFLFHPSDLRRTQLHGPPDHEARILDDQQQAYGASAQRLRAEVLVRRRLVRDPKGRVSDRELGDERRFFVRATHAIDLERAEGRLVELDGLAATANRELRRDADLRRLGGYLSHALHRSFCLPGLVGRAGAPVTVAWLVISRAPRPCVAKLNNQRMNTRSRFWKPTRYQRWTTSQVTHAMKPLSFSPLMSATAAARPMVARLPLSWYLNRRGSLPSSRARTA